MQIGTSDPAAGIQVKAEIMANINETFTTLYSTTASTGMLIYLLAINVVRIKMLMN